MLPPGVAYLAKQVPFLLLPSAFWYTLLNVYLGRGFYVWMCLLLGLSSLPILFSALATYERSQIRRNASARHARLPPVVSAGWGIIGDVNTMVSMLRNFKEGYPSDYMGEWPKQYGCTFIVQPLFSNMIFTMEPDVIKSLLATQFGVFEKGPRFISCMHAVLGTGVFNSDGKFHRALTRPFFARSRISDFDTFDRHAERAISLMRSHLSSKGSVDFQDIISRFTLDSASSFLFGIELGTLCPSDNYADQFFTRFNPVDFAASFSRAQMIVALREVTGPSWPLAEFWKDQVKSEMDVVNKFISFVVEEALCRAKVNRESSRDKDSFGEVNEGDTLLDHLVRHTDDPVVIKDEIINILVAGKDTTASTLTFVVYMLTEHPYVLERLREEILSIIGPSRRPTMDDFKNMKYLRAIINETLRLYPTVPFNVRILYSVFMMHRRKDLWGPDALDFDPDRFIDERLQKYLVPNPFIFLPFNAGPRICLGQQFAYNEISFFLVRLLQAFSTISLGEVTILAPSHWSVNAEGRQKEEKVRLQLHLTLYIEVCPY
ncbi:cytochrome P450 [Crucibulum laeve]|uniref:Cytochrome P450 n=1 Tax=Crucibulum laeve TaxID=68775 RepID=A0A5C3M3F0_9AGAR|nr:cytochrome P450 [Crucibulum laeve]